MPDRSKILRLAMAALLALGGASTYVWCQEPSSAKSPVPKQAEIEAARRRVQEDREERRARGYERPVSEEYLALLVESYARFFYHYNAAPVLIVNSENLNFVERDADFELLVSRLRAMKSRREFFNLG